MLSAAKNAIGREICASYHQTNVLWKLVGSESQQGTPTIGQKSGAQAQKKLRRKNYAARDGTKRSSLAQGTLQRTFRRIASHSATRRSASDERR